MAFFPPTVDQVRDYATEQAFTDFNAERFVDYYEMIGWKVSGRTPMKSWKAAVRYWRSNQKDHAKARPASLGALQMQLKKTEEEIDEILRPGGCAFATTPTGDKRIRYDFLITLRRQLKFQIEHSTP